MGPSTVLPNRLTTSPLPLGEGQGEGPSQRALGLRRGSRLTRLLAALLLAATAPQPAAAQPGPLFPDLTGDALTTALAATYAPTATVPYDRARDTLFAAVYLERLDDGTSTDSLRGLYSGHAVWLDPALDPTAAAWAASPRVSTEHLWPASRGATEGTPAYQDLHHLAPVMQSVNSSRRDHPFAEIPDAEADRWWGPDGLTHTAPPPAPVRDLYTEKRNGADAALEPRESVAGDVARALFYVWAVYGPSGADQLDRAFWAAQRDVLLDWHAQDPVDQAEADRTRVIETHQGTPNPFVLDPSLAARAFGPPPVDVALASFTAVQTPDGARVEWTTSAEAGIASFRLDGRPDVFGALWEPWATTAAGNPPAYVVDVTALEVGTYRVGLVAIDGDGVELALGDIGLTIEPTTAGEDDPDTPSFTLAAPTPNPADGRASATLTVTKPVHVLAIVHDALGREALVAYDQVAVGRIAVEIDTTALAPGGYVLRVVAIDGSAAASRRFTVTR